ELPKKLDSLQASGYHLRSERSQFAQAASAAFRHHPTMPIKFAKTHASACWQQSRRPEPVVVPHMLDPSGGCGSEDRAVRPDAPFQRPAMGVDYPQTLSVRPTEAQDLVGGGEQDTT